jgi:hypothetical protein
MKEYKVLVIVTVVWYVTGISRVITDNETSGIENATHNTFPKLNWPF